MFKMSKNVACNWLKHSMSLWAALNSVWIHLNTSAEIHFDETGFICLGAAYMCIILIDWLNVTIWLKRCTLLETKLLY